MIVTSAGTDTESTPLQNDMQTPVWHNNVSGTDVCAPPAATSVVNPLRFNNDALKGSSSGLKYFIEDTEEIFLAFLLLFGRDTTYRELNMHQFGQIMALSDFHRLGAHRIAPQTLLVLLCTHYTSAQSIYNV